MKVLQMFVFVVLGISASVLNAATILTATDENVNFIVPADFAYDVAVFANVADLASGTNPLSVSLNNFIPGVFGGPDLVSGQAAPGLGNSFVVGISGDSGVSWLSDIGFNGGGGAGVLSFSVGQLNIDVLLVDVQVVPVPAAAWLFGSGLIGLVAVARRKGLQGEKG